ncbi:hypothetical protein L5515_018570 [Caenorhabditis briggsae]|uniref:7TM GPCR serpentine receptor class x (Srx) domain-containing protein n=1 Tax=Caenorhabditis briggsae TaxID=6238 RepID=A0AAE9JT19_CAEBR|nr:hypothetical protein L5515_018570 [Caenorhabditis briggsae]
MTPLLVIRLPPVILYTKHSSSTRRTISIVLQTLKYIAIGLFYWSSRIFQHVVLFFQPLLNNFIVLLASQRFVFVFLPEKAHFLAKRRATRIYIITIWTVSILFGALIELNKNIPYRCTLSDSFVWTTEPEILPESRQQTTINGLSANFWFHFVL